PRPTARGGAPGRAGTPAAPEVPPPSRAAAAAAMGSEGLPFLRDSMDYANNGSAMPESHEEPVKRGMRIVENAFNGKVEAQLQELQGLKKLTEELQLQSNVLNEKNSTLQAELHQSQQVGNQLADENKELFKQVQQLRKKMARLDILKNKVLESITHAGDDDDALEVRRAPRERTPEVVARGGGPAGSSRPGRSLCSGLRAHLPGAPSGAP
ncbi:unnamed protein product, partial [Prorocentrum cordatum]